MTLDEFIDNYDYPDSIILLEGKRNVLEADQPKLVALGELLASSTQHMVFRSGNAPGADDLFSAGVAKVDHKRLQVITPYSGHRKKSNVAYETFALDELNISEEPEVIYQSKGNKKVEKLVDQFVAGEKHRNSIKAAYILRDTIKVIGTKAIPPATFGIFYDDLNHPQTGGTGHTMEVCAQNNIPLIDQRVWMEWVG
jgi:hypothetical protein